METADGRYVFDHVLPVYQKKKKDSCLFVCKSIRERIADAVGSRVVRFEAEKSIEVSRYLAKHREELHDLVFEAFLRTSSFCRTKKSKFLFLIAIATCAIVNTPPPRAPTPAVGEI